MNWEDSHFAAQAFAKSRGDVSLGEQWALASIMHENSPNAGRASSKPVERKKEKEVKPYKDPGKYIALAYFGTLAVIALFAALH